MTAPNTGHEGRLLPMFPLGSVLLPGMLLPLHVFESRYRRMLELVTATDPPEFGVTLIERGSEVGGGEVRSGIGCIARVLDAERLADGRWQLVALGTTPIRVLDWLEDAPHPRATVVAHVDLEEEPPGADELDRLQRQVRVVAELAAEVGAGLLTEPVYSEDPTRRVHQFATISPLGALDRQRILSCDRLSTRIQLLGELVEDQRLLLEAQRGPGDGPR